MKYPQQRTELEGFNLRRVCFGMSGCASFLYAGLHYALERIAKMSLIRIHVCSVTSRSLADPAGPVKINRSNKFSQILRFNFVQAAILLMSSEVPFLSTPSCQACHQRPVFILMDLVIMIA